MMKYIAILVLVVGFVEASYGAECENPVARVEGSAENPRKSLISSLPGDSSSIVEPDCRSRPKDEREDNVPVQVDVDIEANTPIAEGTTLLEQSFEVHKNSSANAIDDLRQAVDALKEDILKLLEEIKTMEASNDKKFKDLESELLRTNEAVKANDKNIRADVGSLRQGVDALKEDILKPLEGKIKTMEASNDKKFKDLESKLLSADEAVKANNDKAIKVNDLSIRAELDRYDLYLMASILAVLLLLASLFFFLRHKVSIQRLDLADGLLNTRKSLEEEFLRIDNKLVEIFEAQMQEVSRVSNVPSAEVDHSLAIKVADEIVRIQKNISRMDEKTKGLKQLLASVARIQDNMSSNGYEIVEMLDMPYNEGMRVSATFVPDEDLGVGEQVISRVIKPQINYQGVMIQSAQIEVSQGE